MWSKKEENKSMLCYISLIEEKKNKIADYQFGVVIIMQKSSSARFIHFCLTVVCSCPSKMFRLFIGILCCND